MEIEQIIQGIYDTQAVVGRSGTVHQLKAAINRREGKFLFDLIQSDCGIQKTLEVGCAYGLSSLHICWALRERAGASHTIIDPFQNSGYDGVGVMHLDQARIEFFELIERKSEFALPRLLEEKEGRFDFVFIDGWHTFDHTLLDCFYATRLLRVGGYLAIDDADWPSIRRVVGFLKNYPCFEEYGSVRNKQARTWKKVAARILLSPVPRTILPKILSRSLYGRIFPEECPATLVAFKKTANDTRDWRWHSDAF